MMARGEELARPGIAILGAGRIAQVHARAIQSNGGHLAACFDVDQTAATVLAARFSCEIETSVQRLVGRSDVHGVIIATPTDTHVDFIRLCLASGKRVLCEKPLALTLDDAAELVREVGEQSSRIQLGFNRRFDPSHAALYLSCRQGHIGNLEQLIITSRDPEPPTLAYARRSGGIFRDMTIHDFDTALWLLDEPVVRISASGSCLIDKQLASYGDYDSALTTMITASGRQCVIINSRRAVYGYDQRIEAFGSEGMLLSDNHSENALCLSQTDSYQKRTRLTDFFIDRYRQSFEREIAAFTDSIARNEPAVVDAADGLRAMQLSEAATQSALTGKWVTVEPDWDHH